MNRANGWFMCRIGYVETIRAVGLAAGRSAVKSVRQEWPAIGVVELDQPLVEHAADLTISQDLPSLDALHLAAALVLPREDLVVATWDRRLHAAAIKRGLSVIPDALD
jgi:predicted nucleic acid-binding protein